MNLIGLTMAFVISLGKIKKVEFKVLGKLIKEWRLFWTTEIGFIDLRGQLEGKLNVTHQICRRLLLSDL